MLTPMCALPALGTAKNQMIEVKSRLDGLQVNQNFSIVEMLNKGQAGQGRRTQQVEKSYLTAPATQ